MTSLGSGYVSRLATLCACLLALAACAGETGPAGSAGRDGADGTDGRAGTDGTDGTDGRDGTAGRDGTDGLDGRDGMDATLEDGDVPTFVVARVDEIAAGTLDAEVTFPLDARATDSVRAVAGLTPSRVVSWLDPLTLDRDPRAPHFGANADYTAYFGDGWNASAGDAPQWHGSGQSGWLWVNHEYISTSSPGGVNFPPTATSAPTGMHHTLAWWMRKSALLTNDIDSSTWAQVDLDAYQEGWRREVGGSWLRVVQDPATGHWTVDRSSTPRRYDATASTRFRLDGITRLSGLDSDEAGGTLPAGVVSGTHSNCSGAQTPWGTIITAEENAQFAYGELESCFNSSMWLNPAGPCAPGAPITFTPTPAAGADFSRHSDPRYAHSPDVYGYLTEIDPGVAPDEYYGSVTPGVGHRKLGAIGRANWENATFAVDADWRLPADQPIVLYMGDDRRSGRIYRFVTTGVYRTAMSRAETRALLDSGTLYVAHFEDMAQDGASLSTGGGGSESAPGSGRWIEVSTTSTDIAPNAAALGAPTVSVGEALLSNTWNHMGGFADDSAVRLALFVAANKIGVRELNRPEDLEWNPRDPSGTATMYVAFTNNTRQRALDADGELHQFPTSSAHTAASGSFNPADALGSIWAIRESVPEAPGTSETFTFWRVFRGTRGTSTYDAANPDNLVIDRYGHVWFGTDGNFGTADHADGVYYLDLDPAHASTPTPTYGRPFRVMAVPSDAEATGPSFSSDMRTLFVSVQHPGEEAFSTWPGTSLADAPRSSVVALSRRVSR